MRHIGLLGVLCWAANYGYAAPGNTLFSDDFRAMAPLQLQISGPLAALARDQDVEPASRAGTLTLGDSDTSFRIGLKPRGKSRRNRSNCRFPPLWLEFDKADIVDTPFAGHHRRKLVTQCVALSASNRDPSKIWLEMLAYRAWNLLTEQSLRVHPVQITWQDSATPKKTHQHAGFIIEHKKELARRSALAAAKMKKVKHAALDPALANLAALLNLMIGNPDFSLTSVAAGDNCCHNSVPMQDANGRVQPIIYDFDNTGLVNPKYGSTPPHLKLASVRQRVYRGYCRHNAQVASSVAQLLARRTEIESLFAEHPGISQSEKRRVAKYLGAFFTRYTNAKDQQRRLVGRCLG